MSIFFPDSKDRLLQADDDEEGKEKLTLVKDEARGRRQPQKQGSAIDLDIGPPLEPNQVEWNPYCREPL